MRVATYTRISTDEDHQPFSLGAQQERLLAYSGVQEGWQVVRQFTDQTSGATLERPGLKTALEEAASGVFELLLVWRVDRLSRNVRQLAQLVEELDKAGVALRSATEPFDTSSAAGKMMLQMLGVFAEFERTTIVERITAGMERAASQGRWVVGKVPFGYLRAQQTKLIHPDPAQAEVVRRIFELYTTKQMGAEAIAKLLNAEGHRTKNGLPFARPIVLAILANPIYVGSIVFRGATSTGLHDPIVEQSVFEAAARILEERAESQALRRGHPTDYLLSGLIRCGQCNRAYVGTTATGRSRTYSYYTCSTRYRYGTKECSADRLPRELLEDQVFDQLAEVYRDSELIADALDQARLATEQDRGESERRLEALRQERAGSQRALDRYFAAFEEGSLSPAQCKERIGALHQRLDSLAAEEVSLSGRVHDDDAVLVTAEDLAKWAQDLPGLLLAGSAQQRKALLRKLIKELRVMSRYEIVPTYKIPALVRAPMGQVELRGFEPLASAMPWRRSTK